MVYNPATDFLGIWRNIAGQVSKVEMPGLDYVVATLSRAGLITVSVSATAPVANQPTTAWLQTAVPSYSAEGALFLWDPIATAYAAATPALFLTMLDAAAGQSGVSWWTSTGGHPANTVGNNGDYAIRTDPPGGIYGPKTAGAWPAAPLPGSAQGVSSDDLDTTFGNTPGALIVRGAASWQALEIGATNQVLTVLGGLPAWDGLSALLDAIFGATQGGILYRDALLWELLAPGAAGLILTTEGPGANPQWTAKATEFPSGTVMLFQQTSAPTGWTKQVALNDVGLRVTTGAVGNTPGTPFSAVFAQTAVGNTTITQSTMASHTHLYTTPATSANGAALNGAGPNVLTMGTASTGSIGGDQAHSHSVSLQLAYVDVIIATKN